MILGIFRVLSTDDVISTAVSYTGLSLTKCRRRQNAEDEKKSDSASKRIHRGFKYEDKFANAIKKT